MALAVARADLFTRYIAYSHGRTRAGHVDVRQVFAARGSKNGKISADARMKLFLLFALGWKIFHPLVLTSPVGKLVNAWLETADLA